MCHHIQKVVVITCFMIDDKFCMTKKMILCICFFLINIKCCFEEFHGCPTISPKISCPNSTIRNCCTIIHNFYRSNSEWFTDNFKTIFFECWKHRRSNISFVFRLTFNISKNTTGQPNTICFNFKDVRCIFKVNENIMSHFNAWSKFTCVNNQGIIPSYILRAGIQRFNFYNISFYCKNASKRCKDA